MRFIIDRFEGQFAIVELENNEMVNIPSKILPSEAKEGDIIQISIDKEDTEVRKRRIQEKFQNLFSE